ncbi:MAG: phospho-sugar mutase [Clostridiales bacterium]|nr:phospho-sugar mutase [Clostridiales bacterium]
MSDIYNAWLKGVSEAERAELVALGGNEKEIAERFARELEFGTAGMRGEVGLGTFRMNIYTVKRATLGLSRYICALGEEAKKQGVVISYDTRRFSKEFAIAAAEVLSSHGIKGYIFEGVRPVPMCSFAVRYYKAKAGIMITASHNPKEYNGYKVYGEDGAQMALEDTAEVVKYIKEITDYFDITSDKIAETDFAGKDGLALTKYITVIGKTVDDAYYDEILKLVPDIKGNKDIKLVYTPIHGSGYIPVTTVFKRLGINAAIVEEQALPDTEFSTVKVPNPENADTLKMGMELGDKIGADVVLGTDPDCDRLGVAVRNNEGNFVLLTGNQIGILLLDYIIEMKKQSGTLPKNAALVKTIVTSTLADRLAESRGVKVFNVLTGFKYIGEKIKQWEESGEYEYLFGFEESYGSLAGTHSRDKDAVVASMLFAAMHMYHESNGISVYQRLIQLFEEFGYYTECNSSTEYKGLGGMEFMAGIMAKLRSLAIKDFAGYKIVYTADYLSGVIRYTDGRVDKTSLPATDAVYYGLEEGQFVCIRPSGTEPKLKIYVLVFDRSAARSGVKAAAIMEAVKSLL